MIIYIAGKITAPTDYEVISNVNAGIDAGNKVMALGHNVIVPHLSYFQQKRMKKRPDKYWWYKYDFKMIDVCDAIVVISISQGVKGEIEYAKQRGIPVYYHVSDLPFLTDATEQSIVL